MQIDQLFEFVYILIDKKQVTAMEMARHFGVSSRTIYRWMEALSMSRVPVYSMKGRGGGIAISENFTLDKTVLSEDERLAVVSSLKALDTLSGKGQGDASLNSSSRTPDKQALFSANSSAAQKLSRLVKTSDTDWLQVDFAPWSPEGSEVRNLFSTLRDSILKKIQVSFDYFTGDGRSEKRTVHPWKLVFRGQSWYLLGWCTSRKSERYFKLTRMRNVLMTGKTADIRQPVTEENTPSEQFPLIEITAKVSKEKISYLLDSFVCSQLETHKDGSVTAVFTAPESPWLCELLLSFGPHIKLKSPKKIKNQIIELASAVLKKYKN